MNEWEYLCQRRFDVRLRVRMNRIYQQRRQSIMELREGVVKVASLIAGSVTLVNIANADIVKIATAVIFAGTAMTLVFGWGNKARDAARRVSEWVNLEKTIDSAGERDFTESQLNAWAALCNEIEIAESMPNSRMIEQAYRRACESLGATPTAGGPVARWLPPIFVP